MAKRASSVPKNGFGSCATRTASSSRTRCHRPCSISFGSNVAITTHKLAACRPHCPVAGADADGEAVGQIIRDQRLGLHPVAAIGGSRSLHDGSAEMIVETVEVEIGDVGDLTGELPPRGELHFGGDANAQRV